jgi:predicted Mrr-cat superfamily restriction endonuclease
MIRQIDYTEAMEREARFRLYGIDPIGDFHQLLQVVQALYSEDANIIIDWKAETVKVIHESIKGDWATYRWI